ncbi:hypothetical protein Bca52824_016538 [Brassica carinata]|uniref:Uncharacterized protein n=1 Tax=Brassica carinata TaxID=52824 RepID=A0A8X7W6M9_BRACI|nr:hypothetical protein Bca52824_016538 [Brassica carinata]
MRPRLWTWRKPDYRPRRRVGGHRGRFRFDPRRPASRMHPSSDLRKLRRSGARGRRLRGWLTQAVVAMRPREAMAQAVPVASEDEDDAPGSV